MTRRISLKRERGGGRDRERESEREKEREGGREGEINSNIKQGITSLLTRSSFQWLRDRGGRA